MGGESAGDAETLVVDVLESVRPVNGIARPKAGRRREEEEEEGCTVVGPAPRMMARPEGAIGSGAVQVLSNTVCRLVCHTLRDKTLG